MSGRAVWGAVAALLTACAGPDRAPDERASQIELTMARAWLPLARSRPHLLGQRLDEMSRSPFRFLRGSEVLYTRDMRDPALPYARTELPTGEVLLQGDAHPENVGTFVGPRVDLNDFDAAGFGPPWWEVRRAAAALVVGLREQGPSAADEGALVGELARAYARAVSAGEVAALSPSDVGAILAGRLKSAARDGPARDELAEFTEVVDGQRRLRRGALDPESPRDALLTVPAAVTDALGRALDGYKNTLNGGAFAPGYFAPRDVARRCGQGVGSLTALRLYVLVEGPGEGPDDDVLLQVKEASDASLDALLPYGASGHSQASRVVDRQRRLQSVPDADPHLGHTRLLDLPAVVTTVSGFQKTLRVDDLAGRSADDLSRLARDVGTLLGRTHARGLTVDGAYARPALAAWLTGREDAFAAETSAAALAYADQVIGDHARFLALRERLGRDLGLASRPAADLASDPPARALLDPPCP